MPRALAGPLILLVLAACTTTGSTTESTSGSIDGAGYQALRLQALNGYRSESRPFTDVTLQIGEHRNVLMTQEMLIATSDQKPLQISLTIRSEARPVGETMVWKLDALESVLNGVRTRPEQPIFSVHQITDRSGVVRELSLESPSSRSRPSALRPGTKEYEDIAREFRKIVWTLPKEKIAHKGRIKSVSFDAALGDTLKALEIRSNVPADSVVASAFGLVTVRGREGLLVTVDGGFQAQEGGNALRASVVGHYVLDLATGLVADGLVWTLMSITERGKTPVVTDMIVRIASRF